MGRNNWLLCAIAIAGASLLASAACAQTETAIYSFPDVPPVGSNPRAPLMQTNSQTLYGAVGDAGNGNGAIYRFSERSGIWKGKLSISSGALTAPIPTQNCSRETAAFTV